MLKIPRVVTDGMPERADLRSSFAASVADRERGRHRVYGFGPELTVPLATKKTLF